MNEQHVLFENSYLFGNIILEAIPHPTGMIGEILKVFSILCHFMGGVTFFIILLPFIYFFYNRNIGIKLGTALLSTALFNGMAKYFFESARPMNLSESILAVQSNIIKETSFGFPSGHSHVSILVWGILFLEFKNKYFRALSLFVILFTPFSRMYSGVHYPGDVLGGFTMGLISLILIEFIFNKIPNFPDLNVHSESKVKVLRSVSLVIIAITLSSILLPKGKTIQQIASLEQILIGSGSMAGFFIGILSLKVLYPSASEWNSIFNLKDFLLRTGLLFPGIIVIYLGLGMIGKIYFPEDSLYRYIRYFLLNVYIVLLPPLALHYLTNRTFAKDNN